jgi:hypothetical protein
MEHVRDEQVFGGNRSNLPPAPPAGPTRQDRETALRLAVEAIRGRNFPTPGGSALAIAEDFAQYLHDGSTEPL